MGNRIIFLGTAVGGLVLAATVHAKAPDHAVAFFEGASCPAGWVEAQYAQGRMIVATANGDNVQVQVGDPLQDQEVRDHRHAYDLQARIPSKSISAAAGSTGGGAGRGTYEVDGTTAAASTDLPFIQLIACEKSPEQATGDAMPALSASFFNAPSCPDNWFPFGIARGRAVVPLGEGGSPSGTVGAPLVAGTATMNQHAMGTTIDLESRSFAAIAGCCNKNLGRDGTIGLTGDASAVESQLPYVQLLMCLKGAPPAPGTIPSNMIGFFTNTVNGACPPGWSPSQSSQGRLLVGLPAGAPAGATFGGAALGDLENRTHTHEFSGSFTPDEYKPAVVRGCCAGGYAKHKSYAYAGDTLIGPAGLPYIQLLACTKD